MPRKGKEKKTKNINGMGTARQLPNGKWEYRFTLGRKPDGSLNRRSVTAETGEAAVARANVVRMEYMKQPGTKVKPADSTVSHLFAMWWPVHAREVRNTTLSTDRFTRQRIEESLGLMLVRDVRPKHINEHTEAQLAAGLSENTAGKDRSMLYQVFNYAINKEIVESNPVTEKAISHPRETELAVDISDAFSPDEVEKILEAQARISAMRGMRGVSRVLIQAAEATVVWIFSGLREGELLNLTAPVVDENGAGIAVIGSLNIVEGKSTPGPTKSLAGMRRAEVSRVAQPILASMRRTANGGRLLRSRNHDTEYYGASGFRDAYYSFIDSIAGVRRLKPGTCRHTHATMLAAVNVPPALIQYQMGHNDYQLTSSIYTHVKLYMSQKAIEKIKGWGVGEFYWGNKQGALEIVGDKGSIPVAVGDNDITVGDKGNPRNPHESEGLVGAGDRT